MSVADTPFVTASDPAPSVLRVGTVLRVPVVNADPASGDDGEIVYDQVLDKFRSRVNGSWADLGGGGGAAAGTLTEADLFYSPISVGDGYGWTNTGGDYVWGTSWKCQRPVKIAGIRAECLQTNTTLTLKLWQGGALIKSGTVAVTTAGAYSITFNTPVTLAVADEFTVSAYSGPSGAIPSFGGSLVVQSIHPKTVLRPVNLQLYGSGDVEPTATTALGCHGVEPVTALA